MDDPYIISSPRKRALVTAELAGLTVDEVNPLISEWEYGDYEGTTTEEIRKAVPNWLVWTHGCPGGETTAQVCERADRAIALALEHMESRDVVFVGHGHFSRAVITRWIELPVYEGIRFAMAAASIARVRVRARRAPAHRTRADRISTPDRVHVTREPTFVLAGRRRRRRRRRCAHRLPEHRRRAGGAGVA